MSDLAELHTEIRDLRQVTEEGFKTMNGRVRKIELARAREEAAREAVAQIEADAAQAAGDDRERKERRTLSGRSFWIGVFAIVATLLAPHLF